jgi:hypothetical protein
MDEPEKPRFYVVLKDVEDLRRLVPRLVGSDLLARSISPTIGAPRWEFRLNVKPHATAFEEIGERARLQVAMFVPVEQLDECVAQLHRVRDHEVASTSTAG